jgi:antirestriction protein ArdC
MSTAAQNHSSSTATPARRDFRQEVTDSIVQMLEQGVAPWQKPWKSGSLELPFNPTSDRGYRGGNALHLMAAGLKRGFGDPRWMTYKQAQENGWQVRQGEKGTQIEYWQFPEQPLANQAADKGHETNAPVSGSAPIHRVYTVFNAQQIEGIPEYRPKLRQEWEIVQSGEQILEHSGARIRHDQDDRAFYNRASDEIHLPLVAAFKSPADYYGTALHELAHWAGHPLRLDRPTLNESYIFGDPNYAKEELRAELASVFLAAERGIPHNPEQHAAYVGNWIQALRNDKNEIFRAAKDAHLAADFLTALERERSPERALEAVHGRSASTADPRSTDGPRRETSEWAAQYEPGTQTVDTTEKETATEHRTETPEDPSAQSLDDGRSSVSQIQEDKILGDEVDGRSPPGETEFERSFKQAQKLSQEKLGGQARTYPAHTESGNYRGTVIGETDHHFVQRLSPLATAAHPKHLFAEVPEIGQSVRVVYSKLHVSISPFQPKAKTRELAR